MRTYPVNLINLAKRRVVVIGGGAVAQRKVEGLLEGGAVVTVISPQTTPELDALGSAGRVVIERRPYRAGDVAGAWVVIAATDDAAVNHAAAQEAMAEGALVNVVDDPAYSNFIVPAVVRRGEVSVTVSTGGGSPALARRLREGLEALIGEEIGALAELLAELRGELLAAHRPGQPRLEAALRVVDDEQVRELLRTGHVDEARQRARRLLAAVTDMWEP